MSYHPLELAAALGDRFASFKLLGQGGEGAVFGVYDRVRKQDIALKLTRDTGEPGLAERFDREYQILAASRSDRLVQVYNHGRASVRMDDGNTHPHFWFSMEKCDSSVRRSFKTMELKVRLALVMQMLDGLALLHAKSIAHRDIKPDNLFLISDTRGTSMKIGDFGIATTTRVAPNAAGGFIHGSPAYLAPERWQDNGDADWRPADQYAAGVTMFEIVSVGHMPLDFTGGHLRGHERSGLRPLSIPELRGRRFLAVDQVLLRMLAKRPEWRHADVAECKRELEAALLQDGVTG